MITIIYKIVYFFLIGSACLVAVNGMRSDVLQSYKKDELIKRQQKVINCADWMITYEHHRGYNQETFDKMYKEYLKLKNELDELDKK